MGWTLTEVQDTDCLMDDSGVYVTIHRVRADLMDCNDEPITSFIGTANAVRKAVIRFLTGAGPIGYLISAEHASYIGYELLRAETDPKFVQD